MADTKKSFILYSDSEEQWSILSDEQAGKLIKALFRYADTGERIDTADGMLQIAFSFIAAQIGRDQEKYKTTCQKRKEAIENRWKNRNTNVYNSKNDDTKNTNVYNSKFCNTNDSDTDNDTDTVTDTENENDTVTETVTDTETNNLTVICNSDSGGSKWEAKPPHSPAPSQSKSKAFKVPTVEEVRQYCAERRNGIDPERFVDYYTSKGWKIGTSPMKDWKAAVRTWERRDSTPSSEPLGYDPNDPMNEGRI